MHCYHFCVTNLAPDDSLAVDYKLPISRYLNLKSREKNHQMKKLVIADLSALDETNNCPPLETIPDEDVVEQEHDVEQEQEDGDILSSSSKLEEESGLSITTLPIEPGDSQSAEVKSEEPSAQRIERIITQIPTEPGDSLSPEVKSEEPSAQRMERLECTPSNNDDLSGIVVWSGSNTAKELNCRGWYRSDDEWTERLDAKLRKQNANLARCADDPKFRTRLCNHWDVNKGTFCPMKKKNKCIFAHGPVELRVKEGKRHRWGTLVNKHGLCANLKASGGEDTYGAARSIEKTRKEQGQWTVDSKKQGKGKPKGGKQTPKKKKEPT